MIKNEILDLMFNPSGSIGKRKYLAGCIILICIAVALLQIQLITFLSTVKSVRNFGVSEYAAIYMINNTFDYLELIPYSFILFCSFVLGLKRIRSLNMKAVLGLLPGLFTFLFIAILSKFLIMVLYFIQAIKYSEAFPSILMITITGIVFVTGLIQIIFFSVYGNSEKPIPEKVMNQLNYVFYLGKLMAVFLIVAVAVTGVFIILKYLIHIIQFDNPIIYLFISLPITVTFAVFYLRGMVRRINNAGYKGWLFILIYLFFPLCLLGMIGLLYLNRDRNLILHTCLIYIFNLFHLTFIAINFIPMILPGRKDL